MASVEPADNSIDAASCGDAEESARLLQSLTALYVQRSNHTAEEQQQYTELAMRLIGKAPAAALAAVAVRLRRHPNAPPAVLTCLARTQNSADASEDRRQPTASGRKPPRLSAAFGEAFFAASPARRLRMLSALAHVAAPDDAAGNARRFHMRIDIAPWRSRTGAVVRDFARLIDAPERLCERILCDPSGEPIVIAARAVAMPIAILQRILLLASPAAHHSVQRVYELSEFYHSLHGATARALLAAWRESTESERTRHQTAPVPVTNLRTRLRALNERIERHVNR